MILKFSFLYKKSNKNYFLRIMQSLAFDYDLKHYDMIVGEELLFFVNGNEENLKSFSDDISSKLPLSLYFIFKSVEVVKDMSKEYSKNIEFDTSCFDFDVEELKNIKNINGEKFCDIFDYPRHKISFDILFKNQKITSKNQLLDAIKTIINKLKAKESVSLQTSKGLILLSLDKIDFDVILSSDISTINLYTRATQNEIDALATFEKPLVQLNIKDVFSSELGFSKALFILPYDPILSIISSFLVELEIPFLYLKYIKDDLNKLNDSLYYKNNHNDTFFEIILGENGYFIENKLLDSNVSLDSFIESNFDDLDSMFIIYLSSNNSSIFKISNLSNIIKIHFDMNPKKILQQLSNRPNGAKLVNNYTKHYQDIINYIYNFDDRALLSNNIIDILNTISIILGFTNNLIKDKIFEYADGYLRDVGPRIDFKTINIEGEVYYDPVATISSVMSFTLAGVEKETICYGIFDSLADFLINIIRDVNINYNVKDIGIIGNLFVNKIFFNKITKKIPQNSVLHYPNYIDFSK